MSAIAGPESQQGPIKDVPAHATAENKPGVFAEKNCVLKRKLRHAVAVANSCARVLENKRADTGEIIRKLDFALLLK